MTKSVEPFPHGKRWKTIKERIHVVCAACRNVRTGQIICGVRHFDMIMHGQIHESHQQGDWADADQGFVDQYGDYMTREEAYKAAIISGQFIDDYRSNAVLYSEDLY